MSLLERTQALLTKRNKVDRMSLREIAEASNGAFDHEWLKKFSAGKIPDPSVNRIQSLHDSLKTLKKSAS